MEPKIQKSAMKLLPCQTHTFLLLSDYMALHDTLLRYEMVEDIGQGRINAMIGHEYKISLVASNIARAPEIQVHNLNTPDDLTHSISNRHSPKG
jgi:hypothetical protein